MQDYFYVHVMTVKKPFYKRIINSNNLVWWFCLIPILIGFLFSLMLLSEFYHVGILKENIGAYPFGITDTGLYRSADAYWKSCLLEGTFILIPSLFTTITVIKRNKSLTLLGVVLIFVTVFFVIAVASASSDF